MRKIAIAAFMTVAMASVALAQAPGPQPSAKTILEFDAQQLQWLGEAISNLPKKIADPFLADLQQQLTTQQKVAADKAAAVEVVKKKPELKK